MVVVILIIVLWPRATIGADALYMPDDCVTITQARVDAILRSTAIKNVRDEIEDIEDHLIDKALIARPLGIDSSAPGWTLKYAIGVNRKDISTLLTGEAESGAILVLQTNKTYNSDQLLEGDAFAKYDESKIGSHKVYRNLPEKKEPSLAFTILEDGRKILIGEADLLSATLKRDKAPEFAKELKSALGQVDFGTSYLTAARVGKDYGRRFRLGFPTGLAPESGSQQMDIGSTVSETTTLNFRESGMASDAKTLLDARFLIPKYSENLPKQIQQMLTGAKTSVSGTQVKTKMTYDPAKIAKAMEEQRPRSARILWMK